MTLTFGRSPFGSDRGSFDCPVPERVAYAEPWPRRLRAVLAGRTVLDTRRGVMLHRTGLAPLVLFPPEDLDAESVVSGTEAGRETVRVGERSAADAVRSAPVLAGAAGERVDGLVSLQFEAADRWFEEDDPVYAHLRDPYHRVDVRGSSRHVVVRFEGQVVAQSRRPKLLFETGLPVRYYLPFSDVRLEHLELSETVSECPYKGDGQHWHLVVEGRRVADAAWSLPHPLPEGIAATEHVCFYPDKVEVEVDGERIDS